MTEKEIEEIKKDYLAGKTYKDIQKKHDITNSKLVYLIQKSNWKRKSNRSKIMKKNKNAKGNSGGHAPENNKNAVITGEYEKIFDTVLDDDEQNLMNNDFLETRMAIQHELKLTSIREKRMLGRIKELKDKNKNLTTTRINKNSENTSTEKQHILFLINKIEDGLTRVQESKRRMLDLLYKIESKEGKHSDNGKSLADEIQAAYNTRVGDINAE